MYAEFNGGGVGPNDVWDAEESKRFWGDTWSLEKGIIKKQNGCKVVKVSWEMVNTFKME